MKKRHTEALGKVNFSTSYSQFIPNNFLDTFYNKCHKTVTLPLTAEKARFPQSEGRIYWLLKKRYVWLNFFQTDEFLFTTFRHVSNQPLVKFGGRIMAHLL